MDAFAGTGKIEFEPDDQALLFGQREEYVEGSAMRALAVKPEFDKYIFIESDARRCEQLRSLRESFPDKAGRIFVHNEDANTFLLKWCAQTDWNRWRAVVLLDPFAMNVSWDTVSALAATHGVDFWWLFACGAFNRLLTRAKKPPASWAKVLTRVCGTSDWEERFYRSHQEPGLYGPMETDEKVSAFKDIHEFLTERLQSVFVKVANRPLYLVNSTNTPIFMLFFASSNPKGARTAVKIADWIIKNSGN